MSTNHTINYALNQWEGTDKVLRTEFNADNAKIDAALKANADAIAAEAAAREAAGDAMATLWRQKETAPSIPPAIPGTASAVLTTPTASPFPQDPNWRCSTIKISSRSCFRRRET